jgi:ABC-type lipoprotein release transport system permease subunit
LVGLNVDDEKLVTHIDDYVVEGQFLDSKESGYIVLGSTLLSQYSAFSDLFEPLRDVQIGDRVKISVQGLQSGISFDRLSATSESGNVQEFIVKGIVKSKVDEVSVRAFVTESDFRRLTGQTDLNAKEIAVMLAPGASADTLKQKLVGLGFDKLARIQTATEAIPRFLNNIKITFAILGNVIGSIGLVVASITIFIVIYINAVTRRKFIGILKAIGMSRLSICIAYVLQALAYGAIGSAGFPIQ